MKSGSPHQALIDRVIPLPREASIGAVHALATSDVAVVLAGVEGPLAGTVQEAMAPFAAATEGRCRIRFSLLGSLAKGCPMALAERLKALPNADQAYAVVPDGDGGSFAGLTVYAQTELGLL
jgi:hypothetical protein